MRNTLILMACATVVCSFASLYQEMGVFQTSSAGHVGCSPDQVEISDVSSVIGFMYTWKATCKGRTYQCSGQGTDVNCQRL